MTCLVDILKEVSYYFVGSDSRGRKINGEYKDQCKESLLFFSGTSFDIMLTSYRLAYDAEQLRDTFYTRFNRRDLIE